MRATAPLETLGFSVACMEFGTLQPRALGAAATSEPKGLVVHLFRV